MEPDPTLLDSLRKAVSAMPDDVPLRLHLARQLLESGQREEAFRHLGVILQRDPSNAEAVSLLTGNEPAPAGPTPQENRENRVTLHPALSMTGHKPRRSSAMCCHRCSCGTVNRRRSASKRPTTPNGPG